MVPVVLSVKVVEDFLFRVGVKFRDLFSSEECSHDLGHVFEDGVLVHVGDEHFGLERSSLSMFDVDFMEAGDSDQENTENNQDIFHVDILYKFKSL